MGPPNKDTQQLLVSDLICPATHTWNIQKIRELLPAYQQNILELRPSTLGAQDKCIWLHTKSGEYTAKSGYHAATKSTTETLLRSCRTGDFNWSTNIWGLKCAPKHKFMMWKAMKDALPVGANLLSRGIESSGKCTHCDQEETTLHLFFHCTFAKQVWGMTPLKNPFNPSQIMSLRLGFETLHRLLTLPPTGIGEYPLSPWILWNLWTSRNKKLFENRQFTATETLTAAISQAREWIGAQGSQAAQLSNPSAARFLRPIADEPDRVKIFSDAAWRHETNDAGFGWLLLNCTLSTDLHHQASARNVRSALMAEAMALFLALKYAKAIGITKLLMASDSQQLITAINSESPSSELHGILHDILNLSLDFDDVRFLFVPRSENRVADELAKSSLLSLSIVPGSAGLIS